MTSQSLELYVGEWTWNEAFRTCQNRGLNLLNIQTDTDYIAAKMLKSKYRSQNRYVELCGIDVYSLHTEYLALR